MYNRVEQCIYLMSNDSNGLLYEQNKHVRVGTFRSTYSAIILQPWFLF